MRNGNGISVNWRCQGAMTILVCGLCAVGSTATAAEALVREVAVDGGLRGSVSASHGHLLVIERAMTRHPGPEGDVVSVLDLQGDPVYSCRPGLDIPDVWLVNVRDATLRTPTRLVVAVLARSGPEEAGTPLAPSERDFGALLEYDLMTRALVHLVRTDAVRCEDLEADGSGILWCLGGNASRSVPEGDSDLVYRFDGDGRLLGGSLPLSSFPSGRHPLSGSELGRPALLWTRTTPALWVPLTNELIRFDADGEPSERSALPPWPEGVRRPQLAIDSEGSVLAMVTQETGDDASQSFVNAIVRPGVDENAWVASDSELAALAPSTRLVGADQTGIIVTDPHHGRIAWYRVAEPDA